MIDYLFSIRRRFIDFVEDLSLDRLNAVPKGFLNNIAWNFGHTVVTQQLLCYKQSGLPLTIDETIVNLFKKGTCSKLSYDADLIKNLKTLAMETVQTFQNDYNKNIFKTFTPYKTSFGVILTNVDEVILFNNIHEGLHLGYAMAICRVLKYSEQVV